MSHYSKIRTKITDKSCLIKALNDMGFTNDHLRVNDKPQQLEGYESKLREQTAEIIIPRKFVGGASNDIGFKLQEDGTYGAIVSDYDRSNRACNKNNNSEGLSGYNDGWLKKLNQRYAYNKVKEQLSDQGFFIETENEENGEIFLECTMDSFGG